MQDRAGKGAGKRRINIYIKEREKKRKEKSVYLGGHRRYSVIGLLLSSTSASECPSVP